VLVTMLDYNDYVGRIAIGRIFSGRIGRRRMITQKHGSQAGQIALLLAFMIVLGMVNAHAGTVTFTWIYQGNMQYAAGDATLPGGLIVMGNGGFSGATIIQNGSQFTITNITLTGMNDTADSYTFDLYTNESISFASTGISVKIDGTAVTLNPNGIWLNFNSYTNLNGVNGGLHNIATGDFDRSWYNALQSPGTASMFRFQMTIGGILKNDTVSFPNSMGVDVSAPPPVNVPEPSIVLLLGLGLSAATIAGWRKRK
jgi:hypothetical protein